MIERAVILADTRADGTTELTPDLLPYEMQDGTVATEPNAIIDLATLEQQHIRRVLRHTSGNKAEAGPAAGYWPDHAIPQTG